MTAVLDAPRTRRAVARPGPFAHLGPNWFASVMGTGIVANAAAVLPVQDAALHRAAVVVWALASVWLVVLLAAWAVHWTRHRATARSWVAHPVIAFFWGAPPMALMTVGAGTLLVGGDVLGARAAVVVDVVLWSAGTGLGLAVAAWVPRHVRRTHVPADAFGGWLMPVVPPMVSASTGAALVPPLPSGLARTTMLVLLLALFVVALVPSAVVIVRIVVRLLRHGAGPARLVPTLWIVLGPLGQSVTAAHALGAQAGGAGATLALVYGLPVLGLALGWLVVAATVTVRTAREGLPFSLTWWSFTFPVGTCATGASGLAAQTGLVALDVLAVALFALLVTAWAVVSTRTVAGARRGTVFLPA